MPSDSRFEDSDSNRNEPLQSSKPNTGEPRPTKKKIYRTVQDVQKELVRLYTGDYKQFTELTCPNCDKLAIEPKDCPNCGE